MLPAVDPDCALCRVSHIHLQIPTVIMNFHFKTSRINNFFKMRIGNLKCNCKLPPHLVNWFAKFSLWSNDSGAKSKFNLIVNCYWIYWSVRFFRLLKWRSSELSFFSSSPVVKMITKLQKKNPKKLLNCESQTLRITLNFPANQQIQFHCTCHCCFHWTFL